MKLSKYFTVFLECLLSVLLVYFVLFARLNVLTQTTALAEKVQVAVFLQPGLQYPEVAAEKIRALANAGQMEFIPKEKIRTLFAELKKDVAVTGENPFPDAFRVSPARMTVAEVENLSSELKRIKGIDEVRYDRNLIALIDSLFRIKNFIDIFIKTAAAALFLLLIAAAAGLRNPSNANFIEKFDYFHFIWGSAGSLSGLLVCETIYRLTLKGSLPGLSVGKMLIVLVSGIVVSAVFTATKSKT